ncbi:RES domain-containing protein [Cryobacterium sp. MLB-32]|uniref:RES domain-containing protein n=1 Tax=Cryobacterium sp. MLB-32 TaxID=1529318 RepID=UPI00068EBACE|nr:RES domain-containing protein [Cryobacterium sp. MLB-32]
MTPEEFELTSDPGVVWRVGHRPDPWAWTDWLYATDDGRFNGRWDDQLSEFRTLYTGETLLACLLEVLAHFRPDPVTDSELDEIEDPDGAIVLAPDAPAGTVGYKWIETHIGGRAQQAGCYCFVTHSRSIATVQASLPFAKYDLCPQLLDAAILKDGGQRNLTRSIAHWLYDLRGVDQGDLVNGVEFRSRYGDEFRMWAVFERLADEGLGTSGHIQQEEIISLHPEDSEMQLAFDLHGLRWHD